MTAWTEKDFDVMGWHDNHVHALIIRAGDQGTTGELVLDLDYILEWSCPTGEQHCQFLVSPATLTFVSMSDLQMQLDYAVASAGICPFSLEGIERSVKQFENGYSTFAWRIPINWPTGEITFLASGYHQVLRAEPIWSSEMYLEVGKRAPI